jgi:hypothetical protein
MHLREYLAALFHGWVGIMSGIASIVLLFLPYVFPVLFANSIVSERAVLIAAGICFLIANYSAWLSKRNALEAERQRHTGADIRGAIKRGYLDLRTFPNSNTRADWIVLTQGCSVKFYIEAANHNDWGSWFKPQETKLELRIGKACFHGTWERVSPFLAVHDDDLEYRRLADLFDRLPASKPLQHGVPWTGYVGFRVPDFDRALLENRTEISAAIRILISDTLDKVHSIEESSVKLLIGRLCFITETGSQQ